MQVAGIGFIEKLVLEVSCSPTIFFTEPGTSLRKSSIVVNKREKVPAFMDLNSRSQAKMIT